MALLRSRAASLLGASLRAAWEAPACSCGVLQQLGGAMQQLRPRPPGVGPPSADLAAAPHAAAHCLLQARPFLGGLAAAEPSKVYHERRLLGWSPEQLYDVVSRVEDYSQFVPWCVRSTVLRARPDGGYLEAELEVGFQVFVERYTSKVTLQRPTRVHSSVDDSRLFDHLESTWQLRPGPRPGTTWLVFKVDFAFRSALYRHVADLFFSEVVKRMMGAFEGRCAQLYGPSALAGVGRRHAAEPAPAAAAAAAGARDGLEHHPHDHDHHGHHHQQQQQQPRVGHGHHAASHHHHARHHHHPLPRPHAGVAGPQSPQQGGLLQHEQEDGGGGGDDAWRQQQQQQQQQQQRGSDERRGA